MICVVCGPQLQVSVWAGGPRWDLQGVVDQHASRDSTATKLMRCGGERQKLQRRPFLHTCEHIGWYLAEASRNTQLQTSVSLQRQPYLTEPSGDHSTENMGTFETFYNAAAFVAGLSLLERGSKLFVSSTTTLAKRLNLPEVLVAILIAGAEWEELAVVTLSLAQSRPGLAVGNVIGSSIANIFGVFALGLIFSTGNWEGFDQSSKKASLGLLVLTSFVSLFALADILWHRIVAALLLLVFGVYTFFILWTIWQGLFYTGNQEEADDIESAAHDHLDDASSVSSSSSEGSNRNTNGHAEGDANESTPLFARPAASKLKLIRHTIVPILQVLCGFVALTVSGFILAHTSSQLAESWEMTDSAFGATVLSLATSLPEKFVAVMSGGKGHSGLLVADAVGSNVFLLTLCLGLAAWSVAANDSHDHPEDGSLGLVDISRVEAWWLWASALALAAVVAIGSTGVVKLPGVRQLVGALMLAGYGGFLAIEFIVQRGDQSGDEDGE